MTNKERVLELIKSKSESEICDFKREFYHDNKKGDLIKDILSFANSTISKDKFIIFNVDNDTRELCDLDATPIPDISEINGLLREYIEPYIAIDLDKFEHSGKLVAYLKIASDNLDRPYIIKKDYQRNGQIILSQGQIFIRRNTDNFKANRFDLDQIYEARETCELSIFKPEIRFGLISVKKSNLEMFSIRFSFRNQTKTNFLVYSTEVQLCCSTHSFKINGKYIDDNKAVFTSDMLEISEVPFSITSSTIAQKTLFFSLSSSCSEQLNKSLQDGNTYNVKLCMIDISGKRVATDFVPCDINLCDAICTNQSGTL